MARPIAVAKDFARSLASGLADFCYPRACAACNSLLDESETHDGFSLDGFCLDCGTKLSQLENAPFCDLCGMPAVEADAPCAYCHGKGVAHYDRVLRLGLFRDPLKHLIHRMKYHQRWPIAELLARRLTARPHIRALLGVTDVIVPVPLHPFRQIARGYNQADVIARALGSAQRVPVATPIARAKRTPSQAAIASAAKRAENLRNAFRIDRPKTIADKHVLVVDDVLTTGSTLRAIGQELMTAKPASLTALIVAVADPTGRDFQLI